MVSLYFHQPLFGVKAKLPTMSKSTIEYLNYICQIESDKSEAFKSEGVVGWEIGRGHPVYIYKLRR